METILIDRTNHHVFQPLLYQVATSVLSPQQIASPIRSILRAQRNTITILGTVTGVDKERRCVFMDNADREAVPLPYDYLILATVAQHSYFGHDEYERFAPGMKSLAAAATRNKILRAFEQAEAEENALRHRDLLIFILVGAGPTGVEMAGAIAVLVRQNAPLGVPSHRSRLARIILVDASDRVLRAFAEPLSARAKQGLKRLGVEARLGHGVDHIDADGVVVAGERIPSKTVRMAAISAPKLT